MESSCPPPFSGVCMDDVGWLRRGAGVLRGRGAAGGAGARPGLFHLGLLPSRPGLFHKEFRAAAAAIGAAFPGTLTAEGEVNRSALAWLVWPGGRERPEAAVVERLAALVMPWKDRACQRGWGQDTQHDNATFTEVITAELRRMEECAPPPQRALTMDAPALEGVVRRCFSLRRFQYAAESVPVYQLALYLRRLPPSPSVRWTVLRYEALYASGTPADCTCVLGAATFGLRPRGADCSGARGDRPVDRRGREDGPAGRERGVRVHDESTTCPIGRRGWRTGSSTATERCRPRMIGPASTAPSPRGTTRSSSWRRARAATPPRLSCESSYHKTVLASRFGQGGFHMQSQNKKSICTQTHRETRDTPCPRHPKMFLTM